MKHDIQVCSRCGIAVVQLVGGVNGDDLCEVLDVLIEDEGWDSRQSDLWDLRAVNDLYIAPGQISELPAHVPLDLHARSDGRTALITRTLTQLAYGTLFFDAINPSARVRRAFRSGKRAAQWLSDQPGRGTDARGCGRRCKLTRVVETNHAHWERT